ncbi:MAG: phytanoyl-CoA dioxygenase family protein [Gemmatimonadota bacterium]|nr:phytanoyl-CoA dioxygenase family protein [Gemmatimonadota bacterium]
MLTGKQYQHFKTFGFVVMRQVFTPEELSIIDKEFTNQLESAYRHAPFDGTTRHWTTMMGRPTPFFASLLEDPRFCEVAEQLYGDDTLGIVSDANRYVGSTKWHPDTHSCHQYGVKFAYYLEPVGPDTGAIRVIPGSHRDPYHSELKKTMGQLDMDIQDVPAYVCTSVPGDVVAFDLRLWHASYGGSDDRRMCTCVYYNNPKTPEEEEATRKQAEGNSRTTTQYNRPNDPIVDPYWLVNSKESPKRQSWLDRLDELGFFKEVTVEDND